MLCWPGPKEPSDTSYHLRVYAAGVVFGRLQPKRMRKQLVRANPCRRIIRPRVNYDLVQIKALG